MYLKETCWWQVIKSTGLEPNAVRFESMHKFDLQSSSDDCVSINLGRDDKCKMMIASSSTTIIGLT